MLDTDAQSKSDAVPGAASLTRRSLLPIALGILASSKSEAIKTVTNYTIYLTNGNAIPILAGFHDYSPGGGTINFFDVKSNMIGQFFKASIAGWSIAAPADRMKPEQPARSKP